MNSIGIIGGADGPTAVFVSSGAPAWWYIVAIGTVAIGVLVAVLLIKRR